MRIAVIGAGLAGVTTAYELARDGHEAVVYERRGGIAAEGSFAPTCVAAPGLWLAHAAAGRWGGLDSLAAGVADWPWLWRRWNLTRQAGHAARLRALRDLAEQSLARLQAVEAAHQLEYDHHAGVTALMRTPRHAANAQALLRSHESLNLPVKWLSAEEARAAEPGIDGKQTLQGALHWKTGRTANGRQFAHALKAEAQRLGARFQFQYEAVRITPTGAAHQPFEVVAERCNEMGESRSSASVLGNTTIVDEGPQNYDAVVLCSADAMGLLPANARPALAQGNVHSVTAPRHIPGEAGATFGPLGAVLDPAAGITMARMGDRLRVAGGACLGPTPRRPADATLARLYAALEASFPGATRTARAQPWVGRQAHTVDGLPAVGSIQSGLWLNIGHGANAWSQVPACSRMLADQVAGRPVADCASLLAPTRLR